MQASEPPGGRTNPSHRLPAIKVMKEARNHETLFDRGHRKKRCAAATGSAPLGVHLRPTITSESRVRPKPRFEYRKTGEAAIVDLTNAMQHQRGRARLRAQARVAEGHKRLSPSYVSALAIMAGSDVAEIAVGLGSGHVDVISTWFTIRPLTNFLSH